MNSEEPSGAKDEDGTEEQKLLLKSLGEQFANDPVLRSTTRILILISLAINGRLGFLDLLYLTGMGKGSLSNHLEKLEAGGYISTKRIMIWGGRRLIVQITKKGLEAYEKYLVAMKSLVSAANNLSSKSESSTNAKDI